MAWVHRSTSSKKPIQGPGFQNCKTVRLHSIHGEPIDDRRLAPFHLSLARASRNTSVPSNWSQSQYPFPHLSAEPLRPIVACFLLRKDSPDSQATCRPNARAPSDPALAPRLQVPLSSWAYSTPNGNNGKHLEIVPPHLCSFSIHPINGGAAGQLSTCARPTRAFGGRALRGLPPYP